MTNKELRRLRRSELLELMVLLSEENEKLHKQVVSLNVQLEDRRIQLQEIGSLAEASIKINGVFEAAQEAADQYLENIRQTNDEAQLIADGLIEQARKKCLEMETEAQQAVDRKWTSLRAELDRYCEVHKELKEQLSILSEQSNIFAEANTNEGTDFAYNRAT